MIANLGVKYNTGRLYSLFTAGGDPAPKSEQKVGGGAAIGVHALSSDHVFLDFDLLYRYIAVDPAGSTTDEHSTALRAIGGWDHLGPVGVFAGLGAEHRVTTKQEAHLYGVVGAQLF